MPDGSETTSPPPFNPTSDVDRRDDSPPWFVEFMRARREDEQRFSQMERTTDSLATGVKSLGEALMSFATSDEVKKVADTSITREDYEQRWRDEQQDMIGRRKRIRNQTIVLFALSLLATGLAFVFLYRAQTRSDRDRVATCQERVENSKKSVVFFDQQIAALMADPREADGGLVKMLQAVRVTSQANANLVCR